METEFRNITGDEVFNTIENAEYTACQELGGHRQEWNSLKRKSKSREEWGAVYSTEQLSKGEDECRHNMKFTVIVSKQVLQLTNVFAY